MGYTICYDTLVKKHKLISRNEMFVNTKGMEEQNSLINFKVQSFFNYEKPLQMRGFFYEILLICF